MFFNDKRVATYQHRTNKQPASPTQIPAFPIQQIQQNLHNLHELTSFLTLLLHKQLHNFTHAT